MTGSTIDHLVSVTMLVAVLLVCMTIYNQTLSDAIAYQRNHQVAIKANDLIDSHVGVQDYLKIGDKVVILL